MAASVGAAFRIERRIDMGNCSTQPPHHVFDHVISADDKTIAVEHRRQVPVAKVPSDAHEMTQIRAANFSEWFGRGDNFDKSPVLQHQCVTLAQPMRLFQIQQELRPRLRSHHDAAAMTLVEIEDDGAGGCGI